MLRAFCFWIVIFSALQWAIIGIGIIIGQSMNTINIIFRPWPLVEPLIYISFGVAAVILLVTKE